MLRLQAEEPAIPDLLCIYEHQPEKYDLLVSREDYQDSLLLSLQEIVSFQGSRVVEFSTGTGRLTGLLSPMVESIAAFDC